MRALFVSASRDKKMLRGAERQVLLLLKGLRHRGWGTMLVAPADSKLRLTAESCGIPTVVCDLRPEFSPLAFWRLYRAASRFKPTVVHLNDPHSFSMGVWARFFPIAPVVIAHRHVPFPIKRPCKFTLGAHGVVAASRAVRDAVVASGCPESRVAVVYSSVDDCFMEFDLPRQDARHKAGIAQDAFVFLTVSPMVRGKGFGLLLSAFKEGFAGGNGVRLHLVGDGPDRAQLEQSARRLGIRDQVRFAGALEGTDLLTAFRAADVFVFPTRSEGLGLVAVEAQALGLPVIASGVAGVKEAVADGESGLLVEPGDVGALKRRMLELRSDEGLRRRLGEKGPRWARENFNKDAMLDGMLAVYDRFLRERGHPGCVSSGSHRQ